MRKHMPTALALAGPFLIMVLAGAASPSPAPAVPAFGAASIVAFLLSLIKNPLVAMVAVKLITDGIKMLPKAPNAMWVAGLLSLLAGIANALATGNVSGLDPNAIWAFVQNSLVAFAGATGVHQLASNASAPKAAKTNG